MRSVLNIFIVAIILLPATAEARKSWSRCHVNHPPIDRGVLLAESTTRFKSWNIQRAANVRLAGERLNGVVIPPRGRISYNKTVGRRTGNTGFRPAPTISRRRLVEGMGGGVCQTSSTLYAASLLAGMRFEERWAHTWTSTYIAPGFDATVSYPQKDLIIRNPYPFAVRVSVEPKEGAINVQLWGEQAATGWVEIATSIARKRLFETTRVLEPTLKSDDARLALSGLDGLRIVRTRQHVRHRGRTRIEKLEPDIYYPRTEVWAVGSMDLMVPKARVF